MSRTFQILSRTESAATAVGASLLSVITVGAVLAMFASVTPDVSTTQTFAIMGSRSQSWGQVLHCSI